MSIGFLVKPDEAMIWRGPMATQALDQLLRQTNWNELDYLIVDMPPGTGDIQLTLSQRVPITGAVIVTTPQDIALLDARKGIKMFEKVGVPILGIVENMAVHVCSNCGHAEHIFGEGGGRKMASEFGVLPGGASGVRVATSVSSTRPSAKSITDTLLRLALATKSRFPSGDITISLGCSSTSIRLTTRQAWVSITATAAWAQRET
jgi:Mrp family chromosome partitioning ATPase